MRGVVLLGPDDCRDLRRAGGLLLVAAAVLARLPPSVGLPCPLRALTGMPCPLCGLQTSVRATVSLDLAAAVAATPAGVAVVVAAVLLLVLRPSRLRVPAGPLAGVVAAMWAYQLHRLGVFVA
jgi:hypothetical protein